MENVGTQPSLVPKDNFIFLTLPMFEGMPEDALAFYLDKIKRGEALLVIPGPLTIQ